MTTRPRVSTDNFFAVIGKVITTGRLVWLLVAIGLGGIGTSVGFLIGEGAARAGFGARFTEHDRRLTAIEMEQAEARAMRAQILDKLNHVEGSLDTIKAILLRGSASGGAP